MITKVLVANRGEIARRIFRTCRDMNIATVAIYSVADARQPHVAEADEAIPLPGSTPAESYLDIEAVLAAAKASGADAIHPGYGFLSENADFARAVVDNGLVWIGPDPESIEIMGSKIESKRLMEQAGVPVLPSVEASGSSILQSAALALGFPLLVKASAGGGGKGMRVVENSADLASAVAAAEREAESAFGDGTVFLEKYLAEPHHVEVQVFGDRHGNVISLFERDCSIQRRHQKIIEEAPSPVITEELRERLTTAAVSAARAVNYVGAGTVEFLLHDGRIYFLEMNTRLQVEHPVTEMVTGLDLVRLQIEVANGAALDVTPTITGHAIEARLYAEDPTNGFLPVTGSVQRFDFDVEAGLRVDSGVETGSEVSVFYDPMIAKVIAHGPTRDVAAELLARSLRQARIHGLTTNRALLVRTLEHPEFLGGHADTWFLDRNDPAELGRPLADSDQERVAAMVAAIADQALDRKTSGVMPTIPAGWRNSSGHLHHRIYIGEHGEHKVSYRVDRGVLRVGRVEGPRIVSAGPDVVTAVIDGTPVDFTVTRYGLERWLDSPLGPARLKALERFPTKTTVDDVGSLHAPMPGVVVRVDVTEGDTVTNGQVLMVLEAMKMEHSLRAPHSGVVTEIRHGAGDQVEAGATLIVITEED